MKKLLTAIVLITASCNSNSSINSVARIKALAKNFMTDSVFPKMKDPGSYEFLGAKVDTFTAEDYINDYKFVYDHLSYNRYDSTENKKRLDSVLKIHAHPDSIINITVNVGYRITYQHGNTAIDSIKLGYNPETGKICYWPF